MRLANNACLLICSNIVTQHTTPPRTQFDEQQVVQWAQSECDLLSFLWFFFSLSSWFADLQSERQWEGEHPRHRLGYYFNQWINGGNRCACTRCNGNTHSGQQRITAPKCRISFPTATEDFFVVALFSSCSCRCIETQRQVVLHTGNLSVCVSIMDEPT